MSLAVHLKFAIAAAVALIAVPAAAAPLTESDLDALTALQQTYVDGWLRNDRDAVMSVMAEDAVFIPHDGVMPRTGAGAISEFWFPGGRAVGIVPVYEQKVTNIAGDGDHATAYGRFRLGYEANETRYTWIGNYLIVARKRNGRWLVTHMIVNDADPAVERLGTSAD